MVGNVGSGKSTIVEKLTGVTGRSSKTSASYTTSFEYFLGQNKSILIADTPGSNPRKEILEHNKEIAAAFNYRPVSKIFIVAKADKRLDQTIDNVKKYVICFDTLPFDSLSVLITFMDIEKEWSEEEFQEALDEDLEIQESIYSAKDTSGDKILKEILAICGETYSLNVTDDVSDPSFSRMFPSSKSNRNILKATEDIVSQFSGYKKDFDEFALKKTLSDRRILYFEFKTFIEKRIEEAKEDMITKLGFNFSDENEKVSQLGYLTNMAHRVWAVIYDKELEAFPVTLSEPTFVFDISGSRLVIKEKTTESKTEKENTVLPQTKEESGEGEMVTLLSAKEENPLIKSGDSEEYFSLRRWIGSILTRITSYVRHLFCHSTNNVDHSD